MSNIKMTQAAIDELLPEGKEHCGRDTPPPAWCPGRGQGTQ